MKRSTTRTFSSASFRISHRALLVGGIVTALTAITAGVVAHTSAQQEPAVAVDAAREVLSATEAWQGDHGNGCPTLSELVEDGRLDADARTEDVWGNRFRIICDGSHLIVRSAGPDRQPGTSDDLNIGRGSG